MTGAQTPAPASPPRALAAREIAALTGGVQIQGDPEALVRGAAIDSRTVAAGMLFVALAGGRTDGHGFVAEACGRGAAAALVSREVPDAPSGCALIRVTDTLRALQRLARRLRDRQGLRVVGITGSVGKTSTKELAAAVIGERFRTLRSPDNWNTEVGIPLVLANAPVTAEVAILELAMRGPGQIRELVEISRPEIGVVTNVGESHMDFFESREALASAKGELIEGLPPDGTAILNADDPLVLGLAGRGPAPCLTFGLGRGDVTADRVHPWAGRGTTFRLRTPGDAVEVALRIPGRHAVRNALAAAAVGVAAGLPAEAIARGLASATPLPMRLEVLRIGEVTLLNDCYNSSPQSVEAALDVMDEIAGAPRVAVLGDMLELGARAVDAHRRVGGLVARRRLDLLITLGPLARDLAAGAQETGGLRVIHGVNLEEVAAHLGRELAPGAVVLVKGSRAMAMEQIVAVLEARARAPRERTPGWPARA